MERNANVERVGTITEHFCTIIFQIIINMMSEPPRRQKLRHINTLSDVVRLIRTSKRIIVLTGAGVSVSCGIPDFRSRDGIYSRLAQDFPDLPDPQVSAGDRKIIRINSLYKIIHVRLLPDSSRLILSMFVLIPAGYVRHQLLWSRSKTVLQICTRNLSWTV